MNNWKNVIFLLMVLFANNKCFSQDEIKSNAKPNTNISILSIRKPAETSGNANDAMNILKSVYSKSILIQSNVYTAEQIINNRNNIPFTSPVMIAACYANNSSNGSHIILYFMNLNKDTDGVILQGTTSDKRTIRITYPLRISVANSEDVELLRIPFNYIEYSLFKERASTIKKDILEMNCRGDESIDIAKDVLFVAAVKTKSHQISNFVEISKSTEKDETANAINDKSDGKKSVANVSNEVKTTRQQLGSLKTPLNLYKLDYSFFPVKMEHLLECPIGMNLKDWNGPYVENKQAFIDAWNHPLKYELLRSGLDCKITSAGPDGIFDTDDDISEIYVDDEKTRFETPLPLRNIKQ
jgi:hypothetical protein